MLVLKILKPLMNLNLNLNLKEFDEFRLLLRELLLMLGDDPPLN